MKNKKFTLIDKSDIMFCWKCEGKGWINSPATICDLCNGNKTFKESHYIIIDEKNKIAIDSDTGG